MAKLYNFGYKGADRSVYKLTSEHQVDSPVTSISGIDLSTCLKQKKQNSRLSLIVMMQQCRSLLKQLTASSLSKTWTTTR